MICSGKGEVQIIVDNVGLILSLKNVRLIPSSRLKIISLEYLLKQKYTMVSKSFEQLVLSRHNGPDLVFQIPPSGPRLYHQVLPSHNRILFTAGKDNKTLVSVATVKKILSADEFTYHHFKLGHLNNQDLASTL